MTSGLVFDTTAPTHFARAGRLDLLQAMTSGYERSAPTEVLDEAQRGVLEHPAIGNLFGAKWLKIVELDIFATIRAATFKGELGGGPLQHLGECATLALAQSRGAAAVIDDRDGRRIGKRHSIEVTGSLSLVARAVRVGTIDLDAAAEMVDNLVATDMYLPTDGPGFEPWARSRGLL